MTEREEEIRRQLDTCTIGGLGNMARALYDVLAALAQAERELGDLRSLVDVANRCIPTKLRYVLNVEHERDTALARVAALEAAVGQVIEDGYNNVSPFAWDQLVAALTTNWRS